MNSPKAPFTLDSVRHDPAAMAAALDAVRRSAGRAVFPSIHDATVRDRAKAVADRQGLPEALRKQYPAGAPIPVLRRSDYRQYERCGNRTPYDSARHALMRRLDGVACVVYLGDESRLDELQDLVWAVCETTWWLLPAHPHADPIDLGVAMTAEAFAQLQGLFGNMLEAEVRDRMEAEVRRRVLDPFLDPSSQRLGWRRSTNNWNAVCHTGVGIAAMVYEKDPAALVAAFGHLLRDLPIFLDGFAPDGGCTEGPGYWRYGFGWYARLADKLHAFTGGAVDLLGGELPPKIVRYPLAVAVAPGRELTFSDTRSGYMPLETAALVNRHIAVPEAFALCAAGADGRPRAATLSDLLSYPADIPAPTPGFLERDAMLPQLGIAKLHGAGGIVVGVKAGHNAEHHNHNDVGSFILFKDGVQLLCDSGSPIYSAATFSSHRYESIFTNSRGHSVPVIDGVQQSPGERFRGTLDVVAEGLAKRATVEFAAAYDVPALTRLTRALTLQADTPTVLLEDGFEFAGPALPVEEAFMATWPAERAEDGSVLVRADNGAECRLTALTPGFFEVETLVEESRESPDGSLLRRIAFRPDWSTSPDTAVRLRIAVGVIGQ
jgi:hypothetical protein